MALYVSSKDVLAQAKQAELDQDPDRAAKLYEQALKAKPANPLPYERLMIIYRKSKKYKDELRVINTGLNNLREIHKRRQQKNIGKNSTISRLSTALMKTSGLVDKKGNVLFEPEPIPKWVKRKAVVETKLNR